MIKPGNKERITQNRVVKLFQDELKYRNIKQGMMQNLLTGK
jgi:hypothetical protein